jgi:DNA-binding response OmpR family regulator
MTATIKRPVKRSRKDTVLLVDGEVLIRMVLSDYLRQCGYKVIEAVNGDEALLILKLDIPIRIVLSEIEMGGSIDGFGLARWIRHKRSDVRVLLSGSPERAAATAADLCDSGPLLSRPYDPQIVVDRIRRLLADVRNKRKVKSVGISPSSIPRNAPTFPRKPD